MTDFFKGLKPVKFAGPKSKNPLAYRTGKGCEVQHRGRPRLPRQPPFEHELAVAASHGLLGSVDANRNDLQSGWDTDQFPNDPREMTLAFYQIIKAGGLGKGGFNFDAKVRRQSLDPADLLHGHIGGLDTLARGLKAAAALIEDGTYDKAIEARYAGWQDKEAQAMLAGKRSLEQIAKRVEKENLDPQPRSGQQEYLENLINRFV